MELRNLGSSELNASLLGLGGLHFGVFCDQKLTTSLIDEAEALGVNFIDTAPLYGNGVSESMIGNALVGRRDKFIVSTKAGLKPIQHKDGKFGVEIETLTNQYLKRSVEKSLRQLKTDYIDLLQLHAFDPTTPLEVTLDALNQLMREGKIKYFGCSNYSPDELRALISHAPEHFVASQIHYNVIERRAEDELIPLCSEANLSVICNRALARGLLSGKYKVGDEPPQDSRAESSPRIRALLTDKSLNLIDTLGQAAAHMGKNLVELALSWLAGAPEVGVILIGARNPEQLRACAKAAESELSLSERNELDQIIIACGSMQAVREMPFVFFEK